MKTDQHDPVASEALFESLETTFEIQMIDIQLAVFPSR